MSKFDTVFDGLDPLDCVMAASCSDEDIDGLDSSILEAAEDVDDDVEDELYDEEEDDAIEIDDVAAQEFRKTRDSGWESEIDDDVEEMMMDDEENEDESDIDFEDEFENDADLVDPDEEM